MVDIPSSCSLIFAEWRQEPVPYSSTGVLSFRLIRQRGLVQAQPVWHLAPDKSPKMVLRLVPCYLNAPTTTRSLRAEDYTTSRVLFKKENRKWGDMSQ
jgi:hypothetical protein